ncbi:MAG: hypothetical protein NT080_06400 [Spirochaetes bacterium]|nr:hypothetical protein [Spirochaetota bacterium]
MLPAGAAEVVLDEGHRRFDAGFERFPVGGLDLVFAGSKNALLGEDAKPLQAKADHEIPDSTRVPEAGVRKTGVVAGLEDSESLLHGDPPILLMKKMTKRPPEKYIIESSGADEAVESGGVADDAGGEPDTEFYGLPPRKLDVSPSEIEEDDLVPLPGEPGRITSRAAIYVLHG